MMLYMTYILSIDPMDVVSFLALVISALSFFFMYQKKIKNSVDQRDLEKHKEDITKDYSDKIRAVHHRIDGVESSNEKEHTRIREEFFKTTDSINKKLDIILDKLI